MIGGAEIVSSVRGAFRLALLHADGVALFNRTHEGFWRSFFAAVIVAPGYLFIAWLGPEWSAEVPSLHDLLVNGLAYIIGWVAFPVAMVPVTRLLEREERYIGYIIAYNWAAVPQMVLFVGTEILIRVLALGDVVSGVVGIATVSLVMGYYWFIARTALAIDGVAAAGVVALDVLITLVITAAAAGFTAAPPAVSPA
jgi:hypothetical protein